MPANAPTLDLVHGGTYLRMTLQAPGQPKVQALTEQHDFECPTQANGLTGVGTDLLVA